MNKEIKTLNNLKKLDELEVSNDYLDFHSRY